MKRRLLPRLLLASSTALTGVIGRISPVISRPQQNQRHFFLMRAKKPIVPRWHEETPSAEAGPSATRGGDLGHLKGTILAHIFTGLCSYMAIVVSSFPTGALSRFLGINIENNSIEHYFLSSGVAASGMSLAVTSYLANDAKLPKDRAVMYGFSTRLLFAARILLTKRNIDLGMPFAAISGVVLAATFAAISGLWRPVLCARALSVACTLHGVAVLFDPTGAYKFMGKDLEGAGATTEYFARMNGDMIFVNGLYSCLLAFGINPVKAAGYAEMGMMPLFWFFPRDIVNVEKVLGLGIDAWIGLKFFIFCAMIAGMLL